MNEEVDIFPTSFAQRRLWFLHQLAPNSPVYNIPYGYRLAGEVRIPLLRQSFEAVAQRHEMLRTTFKEKNGAPVQVITAAPKLDWQVSDFERAAVNISDAEVASLLREATSRPFDLENGPLFRVRLWRLSDAEYLFLLAVHHIIIDGWSMNVFFSEVNALYEACLNQQPSPLPELAIQYADFSVWQEQQLKDAILDDHLSYWKQQMAGLPTLTLPSDRPRPAVQSDRGAKLMIQLPRRLGDSVRELSFAAGTTPFMTVLAAFQLLLSRYTGLDDVAVGVPVAARNRAEIEPLIGFFVNTLVLRTDLSGDPTFSALLQRVNETAVAAYEHQELPFEKLVEELNPERNLSHTPIFQVMFAYHNLPVRDLEMARVAIERVDIGTTAVKFDLAIDVFEAPDGFRVCAEYNSDLFDAATVERLLGHFRNLLESAVTSPDKRLSELEMLTADEKTRWLLEWNNTRKDYPSDRCLQQLFESQVERSPEAVAVVCDQQQLTYDELNRKANQLAHYLIKRGVKAETLVGMCFKRSVEMIIGLLAVLKAGGAYVPLHPKAPKDRLAFMLGDARAPVLLTQCSLVERLPEHDQILCVDSDWPRVASEPETNPECKVTTENLAYVIYTSGSTGSPKGVLIEQRQLLNYIYGISERYRLTPGASFAMVQPLSVDSSQTMIFPPLVSGGVLHLLSEEKSIDAHAFAAYFARHSIDLLKIAPSHLAALQQTCDEPAQLLPRRWLIIGGEASQRTWVDELRQMAHCQIFNHYGPTEATVGMLTYAITEERADGSLTAPMGQPLPNTEAYVLDRHLKLVPVGVAGELYIGGDCLARGYLNLRELTAEKFILHSFDDMTPKRLYRTGDLVRYRADGNLEFLGRTDHQVKIRGFRVEPAEIEAVLCQHPSVHAVVVMGQEIALGTKQLVAYVVAQAGCSVAENELGEFLRRRLPDYMVPASFVWLDALPLTPHGKVDLQALPAVPEQRPGGDLPFVAPNVSTELLLASIWSEVLGQKSIGVHDNFFAIGGHSLKAAQIIFRTRRAFGAAVPFRTVFEAPTIAQMARAIEALPTVKTTPELQTISVAARANYHVQLPTRKQT